MLKPSFPTCFHVQTHFRHEWARWDALYLHLDPESLFDEFKQRVRRS